MKLIEFFDFIIDSFDTRADNLTWFRKGRSEMSVFQIMNEYFVIQIERKPIHEIPDLKNKRTGEFSFQYYDKKNDKKIDDATLIGNMFKHNSLKVFGIVMNALIDKLSEYDAFIFYASVYGGDYEKKKEIYILMTSRVAKLKKLFTYEKENEHGTYFIVSKNKLNVSESLWRNDADDLLKEILYDIQTYGTIQTHSKNCSG